MPGGLVEVEVDRHHEVEPVERRGRAARRPASRAPGCRRPSPSRGSGPRPGSRSPRASSTPAARRRTPGSRAPGCARGRGGPGPTIRRPTVSIAGLGEHHPARAVEVAGQQVEAAGSPTGTPSRSPGSRRPSGRTPPRRRPPANSRAMRADRRRPGTPLTGSARSGVNVGDQLRDAGRAPSTYAGGRVRPSANSTLQHRQQHHGVGARAARSGARGDLGGLGAARVEHDHPAAALPRARAPASGSRARSSASRWTPSGWRRRPGSTRCGRGRGRAASAGGRTAARPTNWCGIWSTVEALNRLRVRSALARTGAVGGEAERVGVRVAEVDADARRRRARLTVSASRSATRSRASSHAELLPRPRRRPSRPGAPGGAAGRGRCRCRRARRPWGRCSRARAGRPRCRGSR